VDLLIATTNRGKFAEIREALKDLPVRVLFLGDFAGAPTVEEDQPTFEGNALKKARTISRWFGKPALADDSGLVVPALGGRPGLHSARYAGKGADDEANRKKLLEEMRDLPDEKREAAFVCVMALVTPSGEEKIVEGRCEGTITKEPRGSFGFGYDPLFYLPPLQKTMAELPLEEKNKISHRGRALQQLRKVLVEFLHLNNE
jgi:XTP/dITP diphosphohydrolase